MVDPDFLLLWDRWIRKVLALQLSNNAVGELSMHIRAWWWGQHTPLWLQQQVGRDGVLDGACGSCEPPVPLKWKRWNSFGTAFSSPKASLDGSRDRERAEYGFCSSAIYVTSFWLGGKLFFHYSEKVILAENAAFLFHQSTYTRFVYKNGTYLLLATIKLEIFFLGPLKIFKSR